MEKKEPDEFLGRLSKFIMDNFNEGPDTPVRQIFLPKEKDDWKKVLKSGSKKYRSKEGKFNQLEQINLLRDLYIELRISKLALSKYCSANRALTAQIKTLEESNQKTPDEGSSTDLQQMMKKELEIFKTSLAEDLDKKIKATKEETEKKWSDMFKNSEEDLKNQKKVANKQRAELEKIIANNNRKEIVGNLERQKRSSNICVTHVPESTETDKAKREEDERQIITTLLGLDPDDVKHVFRAGAVLDKPRALIVVLSSPDLASKQHGYGKGRPIRDSKDKKILYWVNRDLIKSDGIANFKARHAKPTKKDDEKKAPAVTQDF